MSTLSIDLSTATLHELEEASRRIDEALAKAQTDARVEYEEAIGEVVKKGRETGAIPALPQGEPWRPWDGLPEKMYMTGDTVTHEGKTWTSDVDNNVWEPGAYGWNSEPVVDEETGEEIIPVWSPKTPGVDEQVTPGQRYIFDGKIYESIHPLPHVWSPADYADAWKLIGDA